MSTDQLPDKQAITGNNYGEYYNTRKLNRQDAENAKSFRADEEET